MGCTAGNLDGGAASAMVEIWQVNLWFAAGCCETVPFGTILPPILISTPSSVDALWCRFSDAVSLQVMRWLSSPAQKLPLRVTKRMTTSGGCVRPLATCAGVRGPFKRAFSRLGCQAL